MCQPLPTHTTGEEIFKLTNTSMTAKGLSWKQCVDICTGGAKMMVKKTQNHCTRVHQQLLHHSLSHSCYEEDSKHMEYCIQQSYEDCTLYKIMTSEIKNFQCTVTKWVTVTQHKCCTERLDRHQKAELWFMYSHCIHIICYLVSITSSNFHHACATLSASRDQETQPTFSQR